MVEEVEEEVVGDLRSFQVEEEDLVVVVGRQKVEVVVQEGVEDLVVVEEEHRRSLQEVEEGLVEGVDQVVGEVLKLTWVVVVDQVVVEDLEEVEVHQKEEEDLVVVGDLVEEEELRLP